MPRLFSREHLALEFGEPKAVLVEEFLKAAPELTLDGQDFYKEPDFEAMQQLLNGGHPTRQGEYAAWLKARAGELQARVSAETAASKAVQSLQDFLANVVKLRGGRLTETETALITAKRETAGKGFTTHDALALIAPGRAAEIKSHAAGDEQLHKDAEKRRHAANRK